MEKACNCIAHESGTIPMFLTRVGLGLKEMSAPELPKTFTAEVKPKEEVGLTSRLLNKGYVYIYDKVDNLWAEYYVTPKGYYMQLAPMSAFVESMVDNNDFSCEHSPDAQATSSFITVKAHENGIFYLTWSPVRWTEEVKERFNSSDYRIEHMQKFDGGAWWNYVMENKKAPESVTNCIGLRQLKNVVAEYNLDAQQCAAKFDMYNNSISGNQFQIKNENMYQPILNAADKALYCGGVIFNLDDPSGLAIELASAMKASSLEYINNNKKNDFARQYALSAILDGLKESVEVSAVIQAEYSRNMSKEFEYHEGPGPSIETVLDKPYSQVEIEEIEIKAWDSYKQCFNSKEKEIFDSKTKPDVIKEFHEKLLMPMINMHIKIMDGLGIDNQFTKNFDSSKEHGIKFTELFTACITNVQEQGLCAQLHDKWLIEHQDNEDHLLYKAMTLNNKELQNLLKEALDKTPDYDVTTQGLLISNVANAVDEFKEIPVLAILFNQITRSVTKSLTETNVTGSAVNKFITRYAAYHGKTYKYINVQGGRNQLIKQSQSAITAHLKSMGVAVNSKELNASLANYYKYADIKASGLNNRGVEVGFSAFINVDDIKTSGDISKSTIMNVDSFEELTNKNIASFVKGPLIVLSFIVQACAINSLAKQMNKDEECYSRLLYNSLALVMIPGEILFLKYIAPKLVAKVTSKIAKKGVLAIPKGANFAIGVGLALVDFNLSEKFEATNPELSNLYMMSAGLTLGIAALGLFTGLIPVIGTFILLVSLMVVLYQIEVNKANDIHIWIMGTLWGEVPTKFELFEQKIVYFKQSEHEKMAFEALSKQNN